MDTSKTSFAFLLVKLSSECQERVWCICSIQTQGSICAIKDLLAEDVSDHLNGCYKTIDIHRCQKGMVTLNCLTRHAICSLGHPPGFPWETAHDNALSMNHAINCHSVWPRKWSSSLSVNFYPSDPGRLTTWPRELKLWKTLNVVKKIEPCTKGYSHIKRTGCS